LFDGNVGIGGDAVRLLRRCGQLSASGGSTSTSTRPPGTGWRTHRVRLERGGVRSPWFPWAVVGADAIEELAQSAGLQVAHIEHTGERWFARLRRADAGR
jgi:hypothetical protein